ncbi:MAG: hypothetical protein IPL55_06950 [Saprospiraceae bacterium]|jgi:hypothetical protein|nr:hypothetical protein [Saprospiraceae bacterium]
MKNPMTFFLAILTFGSLSGQNIINVNNTSTGVTTQYTTLQAAVTAAVEGDIIYLYPSSTSYGSATINKKLTIIGPGYYVAQNPSLMINTYVSNGIVDNLTFASGSNGTLITGVDISIILMNGQANIAITRCKLRAYSTLDNTNNILFEGCYFEWGGNSTSPYTINANSNNNSLIIRNNIFAAAKSNGGWYDLVIQSNCTAIIENNVFNWYYYFFNSIVRNNIFLQNATNVIANNGTGNSFQNNILVGNQTGLGSTNIIAVPQANICEGYPTQGARTFDDRFMLKPGSPALGAGIGGIDCGAFAGATPYKLSGIPFIPLIYQVNAPTTGNAASGINVNVKIRANN